MDVGARRRVFPSLRDHPLSLPVDRAPVFKVGRVVDNVIREFEILYANRATWKSWGNQ